MCCNIIQQILFGCSKASKLILLWFLSYPRSLAKGRLVIPDWLQNTRVLTQNNNHRSRTTICIINVYNCLSDYLISPTMLHAILIYITTLIYISYHTVYIPNHPNITLSKKSAKTSAPTLTANVKRFKAPSAPSGRKQRPWALETNCSWRWKMERRSQMTSWEWLMFEKKTYLKASFLWETL